MPSKNTVVHTSSTPDKAQANSHDIENGEQTPLLDNGTPEKGLYVDLKSKAESAMNKMKLSSDKEKMVRGAAAISVASSIVSMCIEPHISVKVAGSIGSVLSPYAAVQEKKLSDLEHLSEINTEMEIAVADLSEENARLSLQVNQLEASVNRLEEMENTYQTIQEVEGQSVGELEKQLKKSKEVLHGMENNLIAITLQNITGIVIRCDIDDDMMIKTNEITTLVSKLKMIGGVTIKEDKFREMVVKCGHSLPAVMTMIQDLLEYDAPESEKIFVIEGL